MIDHALIEKKLAFIETCVRELRELAQLERLDTDVREQRFVQHTLQLALQAALDIGSHITSGRRLGEPETNRELFGLLVGDDWISPELLPTLQAMAGLRNILVHGYQQVDNAIVRDVVEHHLKDLLGFVSDVRNRLDL
ncbi:MAG: DUF86 domain-containing protein [Sedimenticolaceae bacterium]